MRLAQIHLDNYDFSCVLHPLYIMRVTRGYLPSPISGIVVFPLHSSFKSSSSSSSRTNQIQQLMTTHWISKTAAAAIDIGRKKNLPDLKTNANHTLKSVIYLSPKVYALLYVPTKVGDIMWSTENIEVKKAKGVSKAIILEYSKLRKKLSVKCIE